MKTNMDLHWAGQIAYCGPRFALLAIILLLVIIGTAIGQTEKPALTTAQWQADVKFLAEQMPRQHPNVYRRIKKEDLDAAFRELYDRVPAMNEDEIIAGLMKVVALVQDGHTNIFPASLFQSPVFPVRFYLFDDGLFVETVAPEYAAIAGCRVLKIGDVTADEAIKRSSELVAADNEMGRKENAPLLLSIPQLLSALKINPDKQRLHLTVETNGKAQTLDLAPGFTLTDLIRRPTDWADAARYPGVTVPLYQRDPANLYRFEYLKDQRLVYVQQNAVANKPDESIAQFYKRVMEFVAQNPVDKFVIDLRNNDGGNNGLNRPVVIGLVRSKIDERGKLFVITGRRTFSAAQNFVNELEKYTEAIFVGEPTAGHPNHYGDNRPIELPNSKLRANVSTLYWQDVDPRDNRRWTAPEIAASVTSTDYKNGVDPALDAVIAYRPGTDLQAMIDSAAKAKDITGFVRDYEAFRSDTKHRYIETEAPLNRLGYDLLQGKRNADAVEIFKLNAKAHPGSANAYDSLGDGYQAIGDKAEAIKAYEKALSIDPTYASSLAALQTLKKN